MIIGSAFFGEAHAVRETAALEQLSSGSGNRACAHPFLASPLSAALAEIGGRHRALHESRSAATPPPSTIPPFLEKRLHLHTHRFPLTVTSHHPTICHPRVPQYR